MKFLAALLVALTAVPLSYTKEIAPNAELAAQFYDNGFMHEKLMTAKMATFEKNRKAGKYVSSLWKKLQTYKPCTDGFVKYDKNTTFQCNNVDLRYFLSHADMGSEAGEGSSMWGWTSPDGREIAVIGQADGAAFVEVKKDGSLDYLGRLPQQSVPSIWREIRVFKNYAVIGSEAVGHNVQIFDLRKLLNVKPWWNPFAKPKVFDPTKDLTSLFTGLPIGRTHNIVINEAKDYAVAVGAQPRNSTCKSGLIFIDLQDPSKPTTPGCAEQDGYVHDAQCLPYKGPDKRFAGRDICYGYNEDTLTIYDVTDRTNTTIISRTSYTGASYTHQGWVLDTEDQKFLISDDELDEKNGAGPGGDGFPVSFIWDIQDLTAPKQTGYYKSKVKSIDHNQYIVNKWSYQSNYGAGLRILDLSSVERDPTGKGIKEVGFFDIYPEDDHLEGGGIADFVGTWASYPYFKSGWILINTIERGLFSVKYRKSGTK